MTQVQTDGSEQKRERNCQRDNQRAANIAKENKQNQRDENDAFGQVVQHGMSGEMHQITAVKMGNNLNSWRQKMAIQKFHFFMQRRKYRVAVRTLAQQHHARNDIAAVDHLRFVQVNGLRHLSQADSAALFDDCDIANPHRSSVLRLDYGCANIFSSLRQTQCAHINRLTAAFNETAARIHIVAGQGLFHLTDTEAVGNQFFGLHLNLILPRRPAKS